MRISRSFALALLLFALPANAAVVDVTDDVARHPGLTYENLLKQAMLDLARDASGNWTSSNMPRLRDSDGKPASGADITFRGLDTLVITGNGNRRLLLLTMDSSGSAGFTAVLAAFDDMQKTPKLLDAMDVGADRLTSFGDPAHLQLSLNADAVVIDSSHFNAGESYVINTAYLFDGGKFRKVFDLFTYGVMLCTYKVIETPELSTRPDPGHALKAIVVSAKQEVALTGEKCGENDAKPPQEGTHIYTDVYHWDAANHRFTTATSNLGHLIGPEE